MRKALLVLVIVLVTLTVMAPGPPEQAEKLKVNDQDWDIEPFFNKDTLTYGAFINGIDCKFGLATAGEHADFAIEVTLSGEWVDALGNVSDWTWTEEVGFEKDPTDVKDADGYIGILPDLVSWNGDDDGSGYFVNEIALTLMSPSDQSVGEDIAVDAGGIIIDPSSYPAVKVDDENWDYEPEYNVIIIPLLASANIVDFLEVKGYQVAVDVTMTNPDGTEAEYGSNLAAIERLLDPGGDYVRIQPVVASLEGAVGWNGDDDGTEIVSGSIELVDTYGNVVSTTTFEKQIVGFIFPCTTCVSSETEP